MDRRAFIGSLVGGVATAAAVRTWPFRVYSFPADLRILSLDELRRIYVDRAMAEIDRAAANSPLRGVVDILCSMPPLRVIPSGDTTQPLVDAARVDISTFLSLSERRAASRGVHFIPRH